MQRSTPLQNITMSVNDCNHYLTAPLRSDWNCNKQIPTSISEPCRLSRPVEVKISVVVGGNQWTADPGRFHVLMDFRGVGVRPSLIRLPCRNATCTSCWKGEWPSRLGVVKRAKQNIQYSGRHTHGGASLLIVITEGSCATLQLEKKTRANFAHQSIPLNCPNINYQLIHALA